MRQNEQVRRRFTEPFDIAIRGGPDARPDYVGRPFLAERRIPV